MEELLKGTAAYKILCGDRRGGRLSHAYMLYYADARNLRAALKLFALALFGEDGASRGGKLILSEGLSDMKIYPKAEGKLTADVAAEIVEDAALKPLEYPFKLYVISDFQTASPIFQNKLLKVLEEPPEGVRFLLGATSPSPVLDTVKSRVKALEIPLFTADEILRALERAGNNPLNASVAAACGGVLGVAQSMLSDGWFAAVSGAAGEICAVGDIPSAADVAAKYGDFKYKKELLAEMQRVYFEEVRRYAADPDYRGAIGVGTAIYAVELLNTAFSDMRFNANFSSLLYDLLLKVATRQRRQE